MPVPRTYILDPELMISEGNSSLKKSDGKNTFPVLPAIGRLTSLLRLLSNTI
jgi:hypothetical protein